MKCSDCIHNVVCQLMPPGRPHCVPRYYNSTNTAETCKFFLQNRKTTEDCEGCRWRAEHRYRRCTCCCRNIKNLKDCYERERCK